MQKHFRNFLQSVVVFPALTASLAFTPIAGVVGSPSAAAIFPEKTRTLSSEEAANQQRIAEEAAKIDAYLKDRGSPLVGYGQKFAEAAESNGLPYATVAALSVVESGAGDQPCPKDKNNVFGWDSCHGQKFESLEQAIDTVAATIGGNSTNPKLVRVYKGKTLEKVFTIYNGGANRKYVGTTKFVMDQIANMNVDDAVASTDKTSA